MTKYKISFHCGQVSAFVVEESESKANALSVWGSRIQTAKDGNHFLAANDVLIDPKQISFVVVEELIENVKAAEEETTIEC